VTPPAFAAERPLHGVQQLSIDVSCPHGAQQQTRRPPPLLLSMDETFGRTDK